MLYSFMSLIGRARPAVQYEKLGLDAKDKNKSNSNQESSENSLEGNVATLTKISNALTP